MIAFLALVFVVVLLSGPAFDERRRLRAARREARQNFPVARTQRQLPPPPSPCPICGRRTCTVLDRYRFRQ